MNKDAELLAEAYQKVLEGKKRDLTGDNKIDSDDYLAARDAAIKKAKKTKGKSPERSKTQENLEMSQAYETILEFKHINKKFARRYNKVTAAMLKAQPGSEEYGVLKSEREDLVNILKDHGQTPKDLEAFLVKKEKENPLPDVQDPQSMNQYKDSSYTDTADIASSEGEYEADMHAPQAEVSQMPPDAPTAQELQAANARVPQA